MKTSELLVKFVFNTESKYNNNLTMCELVDGDLYIAIKVKRDEAQ